MRARDFVYWLQGWLELEGVKLKPGDEVALTGDQVRVVRNHLALVFKHEIDPEDGDEKAQAEAQDIHDGKKSASAALAKLINDTKIYRC